MTAEALHRLTSIEYTEIWDRFDAKFDFRASMHDFPGITEPVPSITWSLDALNDDPGDRKLDHLVDLVQDGLAKCSNPGESLWILDWQHTCYRLRPDLPPTDMFLPRVLEGRSREGWPRSPYPDGDYYIFLADDLRFGTFGHPWEHSLCVFGSELLDAITEDVDQVLQRVLRRDGLSAV
ncbi:hypothetical protein F4556_007181 [Kitasatospora gansuensis]|uniref:DUF2716 domain-containing protein n=1 Tax=Kitasatospora gansuensis TaxID=258050 RepID=A0A7W7WLP1_9ACTN|nr:DUF2716 domain-containing protein [Kitasatospora gansuensis]MBB4951646.1 hypothetical protein [Kitasatospora gansuensis]